MEKQKTFTVIPAIDIIDGKCVRLAKGDFDQKKIYNENPAEVAKSFAEAGFTRLHVVDLDGAKSGQIKNLSTLEKIAAIKNLQVDFSGGIKTKQDVESVLDAGASIIAIGSLAVKAPEQLEKLIAEFGQDKFWLGADVSGENIKIKGWLEDGGKNIFDFIGEMTSLGLNNFFCTDIAKDGMMQGTSVELYEKILARFPNINLTASGGVSTFADVQAVKDIGCCGVIVGKAIYEGLISLECLSQPLQRRGAKARLK